jgi:hypothetical protein
VSWGGHDANRLPGILLILALAQHAVEASWYAAWLR